MEPDFSTVHNTDHSWHVWIQEIQIGFQKPVSKLSGGFLRKVRGCARGGAAILIVFFSLHCTRPRVLHTPASQQGRGGAMAPITITEPAETGQASWYGSDEDGFNGKPTANGEIFDTEQLTCAHRTLPLGSYVEVTNLENNKRAILRINDRGPFIHGRILDTSKRGARELGFLTQGTARIQVRPINLDGSPVIPDQALDQSDPYTIQVAALSDPANIARLEARLKVDYAEVFLQEASTRDGRAVTRVFAGSFTRIEDAKRAAEKMAGYLSGQGVEPFITRRGRTR